MQKADKSKYICLFKWCYLYAHIVPYTIYFFVLDSRNTLNARANILHRVVRWMALSNIHLINIKKERQ